MNSTEVNRPLTTTEHTLARWMLENGLPEARAFLEQLDVAEVTPWRWASLAFPLALQVDKVGCAGDRREEEGKGGQTVRPHGNLCQRKHSANNAQPEKDAETMSPIGDG